MAKILSKERVARYSAEFKFRVVKLTEQLDVDTAKIASAMGLHPVMVYRWRQEYREGLLVDIPTRRINMTNNKKSNPKQNQKEIKHLKKQLATLQKENEFLKKWDGFIVVNPYLKIPVFEWIIINERQVCQHSLINNGLGM